MFYISSELEQEDISLVFYPGFLFPLLPPVQFFGHLFHFPSGGYQGWEFAHLLIAHSLLHLFGSNQMSDCEQFAQIAQDK